MCDVCLEAKCCDELVACDADAPCACQQLCLDEDGDFFECAESCEYDYMANEAGGDLRACQMSGCSDDC